MPATSPSDVNYWLDNRCARAFWAQGETGPYRELLRDTAAWLDPAPGERWLDLGCGCGRLTRLLWEKGQGRLASLVALDCAAANAAAIDRVRASFSPSPVSRLVFRHADFSTGLGATATHSLDGAVSGLAIQYAQHWCPDEGRWTTRAYEHLLAEVFRVLRPGGRFVFSVNVPNPAWGRVALSGLPDLFRARKPLRFLRDGYRMMRYGSWLKREAARGRFHYLTSDAVHAHLAAAGFVRIEHRTSYAGQAYVFRGWKDR